MVRLHVLHIKALKLRSGGKSYNEINKMLGVSKSTLSNWLKNISWSENIKNKLIEKGKNISRKNILLANYAKSKKSKDRHNSYILEARRDFNELKKYSLFLIGLGLYWGEGDKTDNGRVSVINTDPELLLVIKYFYRVCLKIPNENIRLGLFIYEDMDINFTRDFWSKKLNIPDNQFIKVQMLKSKSKLTKRKSRYGVCSLYFSSTEYSIKIREWIRMLSVEVRE